MKRIIIVSTALLFAVITYCQEKFFLGADISAMSELEAHGWKLYNTTDEETEYIPLVCEMSLNAVRLRVWVNPKDGFCSAEDVLNMSLKAKEYNLPVMIDFHYSDWWADPGKQNIPKQWENMNYEEMRTALAEHTRSTLMLLKKHDIDVKWVQVGNETTHGFLWPMGKAEDNMEQYAGFTQAGYDAVKEVYPNAEVIIHLDAACDLKRYEFIFDGLRKYGAKWDIIGMSVYPYWDRKAKLEKTWKGTIRDMAKNIRTLTERYQCPTMIVEAGVEARKPNKGYKIMRTIIETAFELYEYDDEDRGGMCLGVFYWAPEAKGHYPLGAFKNHRPTKIMDAFKGYTE